MVKGAGRKTLEDLLDKVRRGIDLTEVEAQQAISAIMDGVAEAGIIKAFLLALREKGEVLTEVVGAARAMRSHAVALEVKGLTLVDACGTGGDGLQTVNISTMAALTAAAAGAAIAKHGNRAVTSLSGSADLLEALRVPMDIPPQAVAQAIRRTGFGFLFAPRFHPAMKAVAPIRKALGVPTIFNLLGPLTNPARVKHQVVGVADESKLELYIEALRQLGAERALVVHGADGLDELSVTGESTVLEFNRKKDPKKIVRSTVVPETFGLKRAGLEALRGADAVHNARIAQAVFSGQTGAVRDAVVLNAAAVLYVAGTVEDLMGGARLAADMLDEGKVTHLLEDLRKLTYA